MKKKWSFVLFCLYGAVMIWLLFGREVMTRWHYNLVPFHTIRLFLRCFEPPLRPHLIRIGVVNLLGNIFMFLPLGFFPPVIVPQLDRLWKVLLAAFLLMALVEFLQMLLLVGTFDVDDLILNLAGTALGWWIFKMQNAEC